MAPLEFFELGASFGEHGRGVLFHLGPLGKPPIRECRRYFAEDEAETTLSAWLPLAPWLACVACVACVA